MISREHDVEQRRPDETPFEERYWRSAPPVQAAPELDAAGMSAAEFELLANHLPTLCWIANGDGYIVWYNRRWHEYCGTTHEQMEGWGWQSVHDPDVLPGVMARWQTSIATGEPFEMTFPLRGADGRFRPFLTRVQPVRDPSGQVIRWFGVNTEITAQAAAEEAARLAQHKQAAVAEEKAAVLGQLGEGVIVTDREGRITFVNEAAERLHGVKDLQVAPDDYSETYHLFTEDGRPYPPLELPLARAVLRGETVVDARWRIRRPDGSEILAIGTARPLVIGGERCGGILTVGDDTERHHAEQALRDSEERLKLVVDGARDHAIFTTDPERRITSWSAGAAAAFGWSTEAAIGQSADVIFTPEDRAAGQPEREMATARAQGCANDERWHVRADGSRVFMNGSVHPLPDDQQGRARGFIKIARDETERRATEVALRASEERLRLVLDAAPGGFYAVDRKGNTNLVSRGFVEMMGFADESEVIGRKLHGVIHHTRPDGSPYPVVDCPIYQCAGAGKPGHVSDELFFRPDGTAVPVEYWVSPIVVDGAHVGAVCTILDLTQRKAAEEALRESEARFRNIADHAPVMMWVTDATGYCTYLNRAWYEFTGQTEGEAEGFGWLDATHPDDKQTAEDAFVAANAEQAPFRVEYRLRRKDGAHRWTIDAAAPRFGPDGAYLGYVGSVIDIDDRREIEDALREREAHLTAMVEQSTAGIAETDLAGRFVNVNQRYCAMVGRTRKELLEMRMHEITHPDDLAGNRTLFERLIETGAAFELEKRYVRPDKVDVWVNNSVSLIRPGNGSGAGTLLAISIDVTARKLAEQAQAAISIDNARLYEAAQAEVRERVAAEERLRELNETLEQRVSDELQGRLQAEEALRQAQKMETLGQLTGGVAHDFNNLLQIVTGNLEILRRNLPEEAARLRRSADNAMRGAERAAILTQRLLAFARRQPLEPKPLDLNKLVGGMSELLHRTIGETVEIETVLAAGLWTVEADPNQLENAIINLAVNARDAMPDGGKLTIETSNTDLDHGYCAQNTGVLPGQYVVICVSDTGTGMPADTLDRVFEPFFTTKDVGRGTGLGLSMVYGFVKQSGGHVKLYSEPDKGTTVKLYLPRLTGIVADEVEDRQADAPEGTYEETILVCEDDDDVRAYSVEVLRELGYRVLEAHDGPSALRLLERQEGRVDLLFTDVVLPSGMTGDVLAEQARALRPELKVLFTTGYARNAIVHHGRLDPGVELITKPFNYADLAGRIRDLLDRG